MSSTSGSGGGGGGGDRGGGGGGAAASGRRDPASDAPGGGGGDEGGGGDASGHRDPATDAPGVGGGGGGGDVPSPHPHQRATTEPIIFVEGRVEAYDGENEELDTLEALTSVLQAPPSMDSVLKNELTTGAEIVQVEQYDNQLGPDDLQACLRQREWNRALDILTHMVRNGAAAGNAVNAEANPLDIRRAHPELVLLLRGQALFDMRKMGDAIRAGAYHRNYICADYPHDSSTGIEFADKLLAEIHAMVQSEAPPRKCCFNDKKTRRSVNDYLKIYFPTFRNVEIEDGVVPIGLFGERRGNEVRCLACHDFKKKKYSEKKLYYHQLNDPEGRQARCPASTEYIRKKIRDVLPRREAATTEHPPLQDGTQGP